MIEFGANVNTRDNSGKTALMWLCNHGVINENTLAIVNYLMLSGSDIDIQDNEGNTALIVAVKAFNLSIVFDIKAWPHLI